MNIKLYRGKCKIEREKKYWNIDIVKTESYNLIKVYLKTM